MTATETTETTERAIPLAVWRVHDAGAPEPTVPPWWEGDRVVVVLHGDTAVADLLAWADGMSTPRYTARRWPDYDMTQVLALGAVDEEGQLVEVRVWTHRQVETGPLDATTRDALDALAAAERETVDEWDVLLDRVRELAGGDPEDEPEPVAACDDDPPGGRPWSRS